MDKPIRKLERTVFLKKNSLKAVSINAFEMPENVRAFSDKGKKINYDGRKYDLVSTGRTYKDCSVDISDGSRAIYFECGKDCSIIKKLISELQRVVDFYEE